MLRVLKIVAGENIPRWRSLEWYNSKISESWTPVLQQTLLPAREMASLERLSFHYNVSHLLLPVLAAGVPSLSFLELHLDPRGGTPTMLMKQPWLSRLKKLTLRNYFRLSLLGPFIAKCKALEELKLQRNFYSPAADELFQSSGWHPLPRGLRIAWIETHPNFWPCVSGINITSLTLQMSNSALETVHVAPRSVSLPSLTTLSCLSYETAFAAGYLLDAPTTQTMCIDNCTSASKASISDKFWNNRSDNWWGIHPTHVRLVTFNRGGVSLQYLFRQFSKINTLSLCCYFQSVDALLGLIPDSGRGNGIEICPNLTRVECKFMDEVPSSEAGRIDSLILAIQDQRENAGLLRSKFDISWRK